MRQRQLPGSLSSSLLWNVFQRLLEKNFLKHLFKRVLMSGAVIGQCSPVSFERLGDFFTRIVRARKMAPGGYRHGAFVFVAQSRTKNMIEKVSV